MAGSLLIGVNLAGAEFGTPDHVPGVFGTDYIYPTHSEIDYYAAKGMDVVRLPFLWERIQHTELGPLDAAELGRLDDVVNYATSKGLKIEIEPHNYGYGFGALIGSAQTPNSSFADLWGKVAFHYESNPDVIFGLMNEPHDQTATAWLGSANAAIAAIRSAGATQQILMPGSYWDGAWTWTTTDNAAVIGTGVQDPAHNFAFEVHQYLDADGSGKHAGVVSADIGVERLTAITQWAEATGNRLFLGEVGVAIDPTSLTALDRMLNYMQQHTGEWQGVTYWAGGPWWGDYMFSIEPQNGVDKPQMGILVAHLAAPPGADFNGDSRGDFLWQNDNGQAAVWLMNGTSLIDGGAVGPNPGPSWHVIDSGDFNGDSKDDILWQDDSGQAAIWLMNGTSLIDGGAVGPNPGPSWHVIDSGDFNGDSKDDILWQDDSGQAAIWLMNGTSLIDGGAVGPNPGPSWHVIDSGDFNGDSKDDILWQDDSGQAAIWLMNGTSLIDGGAVGPNPGPSWHVIDSGDFNGDSKDDILWQSDSSQAAIWLMNGTSLIDGGAAGPNPGDGWHVKGAGQFENGDLWSDILWQHDSGQAAVWHMNGTTLLSGGDAGANPGANWDLIA